MKRRFTFGQIQTVKKWLILLLSIGVGAASFAAVPYIARALPAFALPGEEQKPAVPAFALSGDYSASLAGESAVSETESLAPQENEEVPEPPAVPERGEKDLPVFARNLCWYESGESPALNVINRTSYTVTPEKYLAEQFPVKGRITGSPLVLIMHTHGTESYLPPGCDFYSPDEKFRFSGDERLTVVKIGDILCERLNALGIPTLHDRTMYDENDFNKAYSFSRAGVAKALEEHPSIRFVIDLHRDSIFSADGENVKPFTVINGKDCAQVMIVVGTDEGGANHPNWRRNMTVAAHLQQTVNDFFPTLARPINIRTSAFNQSLCSGSLLIECGACGNTVEEAENAIKLFAEAYAYMIKEKFAP